MSIVFANCFLCEIKWCFIEEIVQVELGSCTLLIYKIASQYFDNDLNNSYLCSEIESNINFYWLRPCARDLTKIVMLLGK